MLATVAYSDVWVFAQPREAAHFDELTNLFHIG